MYKKVKLPDRPFVLHICIGERPEAISKRLNRNKKKLGYFDPDYFKIDDNSVAEVFDISDTLSANIVMVFGTSDIGVDTIAHEAVHCVCNHFQYISQPIDGSTEEPFAYMVGWVSNLIYNMIYENPHP